MAFTMTWGSKQGPGGDPYRGAAHLDCQHHRAGNPVSGADLARKYSDNKAGPLRQQKAGDAKGGDICHIYLSSRISRNIRARWMNFRHQ